MKKKTLKKKKAGAKTDWSEVNSLLTDIREKPLTLEEKGAAYVGLAEVYLDATNSLLEDYKKSLEETISGWEELDKMGKEFEEKVSLAKARAALADKG